MKKLKLYLNTICIGAIPICVISCGSHKMPTTTRKVFKQPPSTEHNLNTQNILSQLVLSHDDKLHTKLLLDYAWTTKNGHHSLEIKTP